MAGDFIDCHDVRNGCAQVIAAVKARDDFDETEAAAEAAGLTLTILPIPYFVVQDNASRRALGKTQSPVYAVAAPLSPAERQRSVQLVAFLQRLVPTPGLNAEETRHRAKQLYHEALYRALNAQVNAIWQGEQIFRDDEDSGVRYWVIPYWGSSGGDTPGRAEMYARSWTRSCLICAVPYDELSSRDPQFDRRPYAADAKRSAKCAKLMRLEGAGGPEFDAAARAKLVAAKVRAKRARLHAGIVAAPFRPQGPAGVFPVPQPSLDGLHIVDIGLGGNARDFSRKKLLGSGNAAGTKRVKLVVDRGLAVSRYNEKWRNVSSDWLTAGSMTGGGARATVRVLIAAIGGDKLVWKDHTVRTQHLCALEALLLVSALMEDVLWTQPAEDELNAAIVDLRDLWLDAFAGHSPSEFNFPNFHSPTHMADLSRCVVDTGRVLWWSFIKVPPLSVFNRPPPPPHTHTHIPRAPESVARRRLRRLRRPSALTRST